MALVTAAAAPLRTLARWTSCAAATRCIRSTARSRVAATSKSRRRVCAAVTATPRRHIPATLPGPAAELHICQPTPRCAALPAVGPLSATLTPAPPTNSKRTKFVARPPRLMPAWAAAVVLATTPARPCAPTHRRLLLRAGQAPLVQRPPPPLVPSAARAPSTPLQRPALPP